MSILDDVRLLIRQLRSMPPHLSIVLLIYSFLSWAFVSYFLEETFAPVLLKRKAVRLRKEGNTKAWAPHERQDFSFKGIAERTLFRPFHILALEPMLVLITIYISVVSVA